MAYLAKDSKRKLYKLIWDTEYERSDGTAFRSVIKGQGVQGFGKYREGGKRDFSKRVGEGVEKKTSTERMQS